MRNGIEKPIGERRDGGGKGTWQCVGVQGGIELGSFPRERHARVGGLAGSAGQKSSTRRAYNMYRKY